MEPAIFMTAKGSSLLEHARGRFAARVRLGVIMLAALGVSACSGSPEPPPPPARVAETPRVPREPVPDPAPLVETTAVRAVVGKGAELYVPPWFTTKDGHYDLVVHFHGLSSIQEKNFEQVRLNAAVVSINLGVGTDAYGAPFRDPRVFDRILARVDEELEKSGRKGDATLGRLALTAWSAGFVSVSRVLAHKKHRDRVDAVVLADGFFTAYTNIEKKVMNTSSLAPYAALTEEATRGEKLFAITHTAIPTVGYPSVGDTVGKLLEMTSLTRTPSTTIGPREMHETYTVDRGSFHVRGYEGITANAHIKQIHAMGETMLPWLKERWETPRKELSAAR